MPIRVKHTVLVQVSRDIDGKQKQFYPESNSTILDGFEKQVNGDLSIAPATTAQISFGDVDDVRGVYLELSGNAAIRINGSTDDIPLTIASGATKAQFFLEANLTQMEVQNSGATAITGVYCAWGDPTA